MGIFSKLFGRKKKQETPSNQQPAQTPAHPSEEEVSLEEVNESLEKANTIQKDERKQPDTPKPPKETPAPEKKPKPEPKQTKTADTKQAVYDIKKHSDGWQVIKENAKQAHRVFAYQKEAIDFAKAEGLEYKVYKADGTLRK